MQVTNDALSLMRDYIMEKERARAEFASQSDAVLKPKEEQKTQDARSTDEERQKRETYGVPTLALMSDAEYQSFLRATAGMSESERIRAAQSLHFFSSSYINSQVQPQASWLLNTENQDISQLMGASFMLKVSEYSIKEGSSILKKMAGSEGRSLLSFMNSFKNAIISQERIDAIG